MVTNQEHTPWSLAGQRGVVVGAGSGIGLATLRALAGTVTSLIAVDRSPGILDLAAEIGCRGLNLDITDPEAPDRIASAEPWTPDFLVNCAGVQRRGPVMDFDEVDWGTLFETNVHAIRRVTTRITQDMISQQRRGAIVNITSASVESVMPGIVPYSMAKAALTQLTRGLAAELGPHGIRVNAIAPGYVSTAMTLDAMTNPAYVDSAVHRTPLGYIASPEEIADPILFLLSPAARFITGVVLPVDGGYSLGASVQPSSLQSADGAPAQQ